MTPSPIEQVRRINRTWIVHGHLASDTADYLALLEEERPGTLHEVCVLALEAAREASRAQRDPKPGFYAAIFSRATTDEREKFLKDHAWTRALSAKLRPEASRP